MRKTRFSRGSSGSTKHTEHYGSGSQLMGGSATSYDGPRVGAGVLGKRVTADYSKNSGNMRPSVGKISRYSEE